MKRGAIADRWDRVLSSAPVNATVAGVTNSKGDTWEYRHKSGALRWEDAPPPTVPLPDNSKIKIGHQQGRVRVVGAYARGGNNGTVWLVRCACGAYETRRSKSLLKTKAEEDMCACCNKVQQLKRRHKFLNTKAGQEWSKANVKPLMSEGEQ